MQTRNSRFPKNAREKKAAPRKNANTVKCQTTHNSETFIPLNWVRNDRVGDFLRPIKSELTDEYDELSEPLGTTSEPIFTRRSIVCDEDTRAEGAKENYNIIGLTTRKNGEAVSTDFLIKIMLSISLENRDQLPTIKTANFEEGTSFNKGMGSKLSVIPAKIKQCNAKTEVSPINQEKSTTESNTKVLFSNQKAESFNNSSESAPPETSDSTAKTEESSWKIGESILCQWELNPDVHYKVKIANIEEDKNGQPVYTIHLKGFESQQDVNIAHNDALTRFKSNTPLKSQRKRIF